MRHIFIGYDHIAFLLGLLLAARKLRVSLLVALPMLVLIGMGLDEAATERHRRWLARMGSMPSLVLGSFRLIDRAFQLNLMPF